MIALKIDDHAYAEWSERAAARGLSVEDWLKTETAHRTGTESEEAGSPATMPETDWNGRLQTFAERHRPTGSSLDDRRESIYD